MRQYRGAIAAIIIGVALGVVAIPLLRGNDTAPPQPPPETTDISIYQPTPGDQYYDHLSGVADCINKYLVYTNTLDLVTYSPPGDPLATQALDAATLACINADSANPAPGPEGEPGLEETPQEQPGG